MTTKMVTAFSQLNLKDTILSALADLGYETPTPIQSQTIPLLMQGKDILAQAQTGTGKTAAFALPLLNNLDLQQMRPQILVLTPTRELAIQVAEAFKTYAANLKGFHVLPVYGGQHYRYQTTALKRGVHVIVGTPGRIMDHLRRGSLALESVRVAVLDEADEMLRMGFIDDVEWILEQSPKDRQMALFSATMPNAIRRIAQKHLNSPAEIVVSDKSAAANSIRQRYWPVSGFAHKLDALTRILESETFDAVLVFVRTKTATTELAEKLEARGFEAAPLNGDIQQRQRERTINALKTNKIDILVATDVAARGLDVNRISHVINFDIPHDAESYIHRIGRTGRAGRQGDAILFLAPRERPLLRLIEKTTGKKIALMEQPTIGAINEKRIRHFYQGISDSLDHPELLFYETLIEQYRKEHEIPTLKIAAALAVLTQGATPLILKERPVERVGRPSRPAQQRQENFSSATDRSERRVKNKKSSGTDHEMERYRIEVGHDHDVKPANIVGAIVNEADIDPRYIGEIDIQHDHSYVELPEGMPKELFKHLKKVWVSGQQLKMTKVKMPPRSDKFKKRNHPGKPQADRPVASKRSNKSKNSAKRGKTRN